MYASVDNIHLCMYCICSIRGGSRGHRIVFPIAKNCSKELLTLNRQKNSDVVPPNSGSAPANYMHKYIHTYIHTYIYIYK